jgi:type I restriction enzyme S subunit
MSWPRVPLGEAITLHRGFDLPAQDRAPGKVPVVSSAGVSGYHDIARIRAPGVVTGRYGTIGEVFFIREDFWPLNTTLYVSDFKGNDVRFVYYLLHLVDYGSASAKTGVPGVNRNDLHEMLVPLPPPADQKRISSILGSRDDKIELNRRMNKTLEEMARAIFKAWFVDFLPVKAKAAGATSFPGMDQETFGLFPSSLATAHDKQVPGGWTVQALTDDVRVLSGGTPSTSDSSYWGGGIHWASAKDVSQCHDTYLMQTDRTITEEGLAGSATRIIPAHSVMIVARGATVGRMAINGVPMAMNQTCYALRSKSDANYWLYCQLRDIVDQVVAVSHGTVFGTITTATLDSKLICQPPTSLRHAFERKVTTLFALIRQNTIESRLLSTMRDSMLRKFIGGGGADGRGQSTKHPRIPV